VLRETSAEVASSNSVGRTSPGLSRPSLNSLKRYARSLSCFGMAASAVSASFCEAIFICWNFMEHAKYYKKLIKYKFLFES
jgi:hypothetical protein